MRLSLDNIVVVRLLSCLGDLITYYDFGRLPSFLSDSFDCIALRLWSRLGLCFGS